MTKMTQKLALMILAAFMAACSAQVDPTASVGFIAPPVNQEPRPPRVVTNTTTNDDGWSTMAWAGDLLTIGNGWTWTSKIYSGNSCSGTTIYDILIQPLLDWILDYDPGTYAQCNTTIYPPANANGDVLYWTQMTSPVVFTIATGVTTPVVIWVTYPDVDTDGVHDVVDPDITIGVGGTGHCNPNPNAVGCPGTNPNQGQGVNNFPSAVSDTDSDGFTDSAETQCGSNPNLASSTCLTVNPVTAPTSVTGVTFPDPASDVINATLVAWNSNIWLHQANTGQLTVSTVADAQRGQVRRYAVPSSILLPYHDEIQFNDGTVTSGSQRIFAGWIKVSAACSVNWFVGDTNWDENGLYQTFTYFGSGVNDWSYFEWNYTITNNTSTHRTYLQIGNCAGSNVEVDDLYDGPGPLPY